MLHKILDSGKRVVNVFLLVVLLKEQVLQASVDLGLGHGGALGLAVKNHAVKIGANTGAEFLFARGWRWAGSSATFRGGSSLLQ